jgi:hypothetical protein
MARPGRKRRTPDAMLDFADRNRHNPMDGLNIYAGAVIERSAEQIEDADGQIGNPYMARDTIDFLLRAGKISRSHADAARIFGADFALGSLSGVKCVDWLGSHGSSGNGASGAVLAARDRVYGAMVYLGQPGSSAAWHVIGLGETVKDWAASTQLGNGRSLNPQEALGILRGAIGNLAAHYRVIDR